MGVRKLWLLTEDGGGTRLYGTTAKKTGRKPPGLCHVSIIRIVDRYASNLNQPKSKLLPGRKTNVTFCSPVTRSSVNVRSS